ncbi:MAG: sigma-54-dependent Fis family transcriptional regulator [Legionellales bacterium]|nr:sigma-54-dependent Fis family transcriptional regulator [Legionellales bacterium]
MTTPLALIIDDEPDIRELLSLTLTQMGVEVNDVATISEAKTLLLKKTVNVCFTDMRLPDGNGLELVEFIQQHCPFVPVAVITAYGNMELAITALKTGAFDFISKPIDLGNLRRLVRQALQLKDEHKVDDFSQYGLLGETPPIKQLVTTIRKLSRSQAPVYISGESGTGKELVAKLIHELGPRQQAPFVPVNCGAIPEHLMESEFFGHKKGSFTGAVSDKQGLFQAAHGGTLFLDEVADLPMNMQVKLLRAIQEKAIRPIGHAQEIAVDVRILSATHKNLPKLVHENHFRQDLFYRVNVIELHVPSLQERQADIPLLAEHVLEKLAKRARVSKPKLSATALTALNHYAFPGNIRELENILERAMTLCENNLITPDDLQLRVMSEDVNSLSTPSLNSDLPLEPYLDEIEKQKILATLNKTQGNKTRAAKLLGITLRALRYRLEKLGIS